MVIIWQSLKNPIIAMNNDDYLDKANGVFEDLMDLSPNLHAVPSCNRRFTIIVFDNFYALPTSSS